MPYSDLKTLKPSGTRSAFTFILCKLPISVSSAVPVFLHREHLRTSTQWSSVAILQICADGWQVLSVIARGLRGPGRRTCERWRPGWSRCLSGEKLNAGRHNLEACIEQPPKNDPGRRTRIHDDDRKICGSEQVFEHLLRGELAHFRSPCQRASYSCSSFDSRLARWNTVKLSGLSSILARDIISAAISLMRTQSRRVSRSRKHRRDTCRFRLPS